MDVKNIAISVGLVVTIVTGTVGVVAWANSKYTLVERTVKLEKRVSANELESLYRKALSEYYFFVDQSRKYPQDITVRRKLDTAKSEVDRIRKQLDELEGK